MLLGLTAFGAAQQAQAQVFSRIRIGDADGFGFPSTEKLRRPLQGVGPGPADTNGDGILGPMEFLPDLNGDGAVWWLGEDEFDNRYPDERNDSRVDCVGCLAISSVSRGAAWTDLALSVASRAGDWPDLNGPALPNNATFVFDFTVAQDGIFEGTEIFFNLVFADYDVDPAVIFVRFASAPRRTLFIANQQLANVDGLIQERTASFGFDEVFTQDADGNWHGRAKVTVSAPAEPYTAFDYAELSVFAAVAGRGELEQRFAAR
ncbi:MAG: hypothetical protein O7C63_00455 [Alphaproteobacteria bacterium]|nr:hypothetical protein [Alphaproteobacteria bacterium]